MANGAGNSRAAGRIFKGMHPPTSRDRLSAARSALGGVGLVILSVVVLLLAAVAVGPWLFAASARAGAQSSGTQAQQTPTAQSAPKAEQPPLASGKIESKVKVV